MALQGTLDTFELTDVLRLLAATRKTGRLRVSAGRTSGSVWLDGGGIVAAGATGSRAADGLVGTLFELLRRRDGSFVFEPDVTTPDAGAPVDVEEVLGAADRLVEEWRTVEAVVGSLDVAVRLSAALPRPEVVVDADRWRICVDVGGGVALRELAERRAWSELDACREVKALVDVGLVEVVDLAAIAPIRAATAPVAEPPPVVVEEPHAEPVGPAAWSGAPTPDPAPDGGGSPDRIGDAGAPPDSGAADPLADAPRPDGHLGISIPGLPSLSSTWDEREPEPEPEVNLDSVVFSPMAARALAAAARAANDAERDEAIDAAIALNDQPIDRSTVLRFLDTLH